MRPTRTTVIMLALLMVGAAYAYGNRGTEAFSPSGPIRCDYEGVSYAKGEQRPDADGCNVCTCTDTGWSCTTLKCPAGSKVGVIQGKVALPDASGAAIRVCAVSRFPEDEEICRPIVKGEENYSLRVPSGSYVVYAAETEHADVRKAYWSKHVECGGGEACLDHSPIEVKVEPQGVVRADPTDWDAPTSILNVTVTPSKRYDLSYYVRREGRVTVYGKGFASIRLVGDTYPPDETTKSFELGEAKLVSTDGNGVQAWEFVIPYGFDASDIRITGFDAEGRPYRWRSLGFVRWDDEPPTQEEIDSGKAWKKAP